MAGIITLQEKIKNSTFADVLHFWANHENPTLFYKDLFRIILVLDKTEKVIEFLAEDPAKTHFNKYRRTDEKGETYLHTASYFSRPESIKALLDQGFDINEINDYGMTPLHLAVQANKIENVRILLENGANKRIKNFDGMDSIDYAVLCERQDILTLFEEYYKKEKENTGDDDETVRDLMDIIDALEFLSVNLFFVYQSMKEIKPVILRNDGEMDIFLREIRAFYTAFEAYRQVHLTMDEKEKKEEKMVNGLDKVIDSLKLLTEKFKPTIFRMKKHKPSDLKCRERMDLFYTEMERMLEGFEVYKSRNPDEII